MELTYTQQGDYLLPDLALPEEQTHIGKYGMLRKTYLKNHRKGMYASLMLSGKLDSHLSEIDQTARERGEHRSEAPDEQPRTGQIDRPDELDGTHEQPEVSSGGNGTDGAGLQLAWYDRRTEDKSLPFFHADVAIKEILRSTPHLKATKQEIADFYATHEDQEERIAYIKGIFNNDYTELLISEDHRVGYKTYQNVLHLWEGSYTSRTSQSYCDWGVIANYYNSMLLFNELLDEPALPLEKQQITLIEQAESEKASAFSMPQRPLTLFCGKEVAYRMASTEFICNFKRTPHRKTLTF